MYHIELKRSRLTFRQPAGTSRGVYHHRDVWYIYLSQSSKPGHIGIGECAPLPLLSCDDAPDYEQRLIRLCHRVNETGELPKLDSLRSMPSVLFGLETALRHLNRDNWALWDTAFAQGQEGIRTNGLIWMGSYKEMLQRIEEKLTAGFNCLKMKIGAINFEDELALLSHIRSHFSIHELELRVDANGAFAPEEALDKLYRLAELELHSIEQPIAVGQWEELATLVVRSPLAIALDEELIGLHTFQERNALLQAVRPAYIILKPSLHGGWSGCDEWIELASKQNIGWWATSALESNVGLNAIAQWCATYSPTLPQGLGTGLLFEENISLPLELRGERLWFIPEN